MSTPSRKTARKPAAPVAPRGRQRLPTAGSDEKRERILKAAEALFDRYGYASTTIEQIVQQLGVTNYEMETAAVFVTSQALGLKAASICGVVAKRTESEEIAPPEIYHRAEVRFQKIVKRGLEELLQRE